MGEANEFAKIRKGVRQGCSLSPPLFNVYIQKPLDEVYEKINRGIKIQGVRIMMLRYADDIALLAESERELQETLSEMNSILKNYNMKINAKKTKVLVCSKTPVLGSNITLENQTVEEVVDFCYLGTKISRDARDNKEIKNRIQLAKLAFLKKKKLLTSNQLSIDKRKHLLKTYVWSTALYACETWTIATKEKRRLEAFELWCYRRMLKIKWTDRISNLEVLERINEGRTLMKTIQKRRSTLIGHILRHEGLLHTIIEGKLDGKNAIGRPRMKYMTQIMKDLQCNSYTELKRLAADRKIWKTRVSNQTNQND